MSKRPVRRPIGITPPARRTATPPPQRRTGDVPRGHPIAQAPQPRATRAPKPRQVGKVPNPRKPKLVRHVNGGGLMDLFAVFPDLPRPRRPEKRTRAKTQPRGGSLWRR